MENKRFFYFSYSFYSPKNQGDGGLSITSNGFPSLNYIKQVVTKKLKEKYFEPESNFSVLILTWVEMNEDDYSKWVS